MRRLAAAAVTLLLCLSLPAKAAPRTYAVDAQKSELVAQLRPDGLFAFMLHAHVVTAREVSGTVTWDAERPEASRVEVAVKTASLENDAPALRKKYGLTAELSEGDRKAVNQNMKADNQLDVVKFPEMSFTSTAVEQGEGGQLQLRGTLSLHGVSREVSLPITVQEKDGVLEGKGTLVVRHGDFGMPTMGLLFLFRNHEEVTLHLSLVATPVDTTPVVQDTP